MHSGLHCCAHSSPQKLAAQLHSKDAMSPLQNSTSRKKVINVARREIQACAVKKKPLRRSRTDCTVCATQKCMHKLSGRACTKMPTRHVPPDPRIKPFLKVQPFQKALIISSPSNRFEVLGRVNSAYRCTVPPAARQPTKKRLAVPRNKKSLPATARLAAQLAPTLTAQPM